jgi:hypothetical protein
VLRNLALALAGAALASFTIAQAAGPRFYPDDPISVDNDRVMDASGAVEIEGSNGWDFAEHTFFDPGDSSRIRAVNISTLGEVPDSSWFTNRIGARPMAIEEIVRGPNQFQTLNVDGWPIVQEKSSGITPGFRIVDPAGRLYQLKFDPPEHPEMSSGAEVIGAAFYHAIGYNVVQGYIVEFDPDQAPIAPTARTVDMTGKERELRRSDIDRVLRRAARQSNGRYRALASRFADGRPLGYFKYYGTRPDDPNDIHLHEHRRELRANRVFAAWLNHDDSRGLNTLDMLETENGRGFVRHYMFDFGSIMGSGSTVAQKPRAGNEYILEWGPALKTLFTLGFFVRPWVTVDYPQVARSVGNFEGDFFDPALWRPEYPNPAFENMRPDDAFWAAKIVSRFSDEAIAAVVGKAQYSEPGAAEYITSVLLKRRDKVLRTWLTRVNPVTDATLADGRLRFTNAAVAAGVATAPIEYVAAWSRYDNTTGEPVGETIESRSTTPDVPAPSAIASADTAYLQVAVRTHHPDHPGWAEPVMLYFRRSADGWQTVGLERTE